MKELIEIYNLKNELIRKQERREFYTQLGNKIKPEAVKVKSIRLLLLTSAGRVYLQKRSKLKMENPGLYDRTIGGHVQAGSGFDLTVVKECAEELGFPVSVLAENEFGDAVKSIDLKTVAIAKRVEYDRNFKSLRQTASGSFNQLFMTTFYVGYYDGAIKFADGESSGIETYSLEELEGEIAAKPERFTEDLKYMVKKFKKIIKPIK